MAKNINNNINSAVDALKQNASTYQQANPLSPLIEQTPNLLSMTGSASSSYIKNAIAGFDSADKKKDLSDRASYIQESESKRLLNITRASIQENEKKLKIAEKSFKLNQKSSKEDINALNTLKQSIKLQKEKEVLYKKEYEKIREQNVETRNGAIYRKNNLEALKHSASVLSGHLSSLDNKRQNSLRGHILGNGIRGGIRSYGMNKISSSAGHLMGLGGEEGATRLGSLVGVGVGLAAAGGVALIAEIGKAILGRISDDIQTSDIYRGTGSNLSSRSFSDNITYGHIHDGINLSPEEAMKASRIMQQSAGNMIGDYSGAVSATASFDRSAGLNVGTFGNTYGYLARNTKMNTSAEGIKDFSINLASELGKGKLATLSEESLKGLMQLVELTKKNSLDGPDASKYMSLISTMSSTGHKGLMGENAASVIATFDNNIKNPTSQIGSIIAMQSVAAVMKRHGMSGYTNPFAISNRQASGIALTDDHGNQIGQEIPYEMAKRSQKILGGDKEMQINAFSNYMRLPPELGAEILKNPEMLNFSSNGSIVNRYGLDKNSILQPGGIKFLENLSEGDNMFKGAGADRRGKALKYAIEKAKLTNPGGEVAQQLDKIFSESGEFNDKASLIGQTLSNAGVTPEETLRAGQNIVQDEIKGLVGKAVDFLSEIAGSIVHSTLLGNAAAAKKYDETNARVEAFGVKDSDISLFNRGEEYTPTFMEKMKVSGDIDVPFRPGIDKKGAEEENKTHKYIESFTKDNFDTYKDVAKDAAAKAGIPFSYFSGIIMGESHGHNQTRRNSDKPGSIDVGPAQLNSQNFAQFHHDLKEEGDPNISLYDAARVAKVALVAAKGDLLLANEYYHLGIHAKPEKIKEFEPEARNRVNYALSHPDTPPQTTSDTNNQNTTKISIDHRFYAAFPSGTISESVQSTSVSAGGMAVLKPITNVNLLPYNKR